MRYIGFAFIPLFLFVLLMAPSHGVAVTKGIQVAAQGGQGLHFYKDCRALVVGVSAYDKWPDLPNAVKDAKEVSRFLQQRDFKVRLVTDPTSQELKDALNDFVRKDGFEPECGIVFYYAGNGETQTLPDGTRLGWIIPRDCPLFNRDPQGFAGSAISTKAMEKYSAQIQSKHVLMLFDSSFSGAVFSLKPATLKLITEKSALPVRQYIIAGREHEPIPDPSVFKRYLLKGLQGDADIIRDGYVTGSELGVYLSDRVVKSTGGHQQPQCGKIDDPAFAGGDFVFKVADIRSEICRLFVNTDPKGARVRILNIRPRFRQGMELEPGKYHMEVSATGHSTKKEWIKVESGEDKRVHMSLGKFRGVLANSMGMKFIFIRPGSFVMGDPADGNTGLADEKGHSVTLTRGYYMQSREVTVGQFREFAKATGYKTEAENAGGSWVRTESGAWKKKRGVCWGNPGYRSARDPHQLNMHPATCVTWNDAQAFKRWLSRKEGRRYDLPTEAEWEYACRAGTTTPFAFGRCLSTDQANFGGVGPHFPDCQALYTMNRKGPVKAGSLAANPWGLFDMHGNVSEWCQDWYGRFTEGAVTDPKGPSSGTERVMRGGHYFSKAHE